MESKKAAALTLILIGSFFLLKNLNLIPKININLVWPILLIALGLLFIYKPITNKKWTSFNGETRREVYEWETDNPFLVRVIMAIASIFVIIIVSFVLLGVLGPVFLFLILLIPLVLIAVLGAAFIKLLIPIAILAAPVILLIWLLSLIF